jgi:formylglycine-generating enzyme required for sulfatase activity
VANPRGVTLPVGLMAANRLGLVDMTGNAAELVADCWVPDLSQLPVDGTAMSATGEQPCTTGVRRGTSWRSQVTDVRPSKRDVGGPSSSTGFRVARDLALSERSGIGALASPTFAEVAGQTASR